MLLPCRSSSVARASVSKAASPCTPCIRFATFWFDSIFKFDPDCGFSSEGRAKFSVNEYIICDMDTWIRVANASELMPDGLGTAVKADGIRIALFQWEGKLYAVEDLCPHLGFPLSEGM